MWTGFGHSINTYFVPLEQKIGAENAVDVATFVSSVAGK